MASQLIPGFIRFDQTIQMFSMRHSHLDPATTNGKSNRFFVKLLEFRNGNGHS